MTRAIRDHQRRRGGGFGVFALVAFLAIAAVLVWMAYSGMMLDDARGRSLDLTPSLPDRPSVPQVNPPSVPTPPTPPAPIG